MSYHGGCDIIKGEKWIANNWINILGESRESMVSYKNPKKRIKQQVGGCSKRNLALQADFRVTRKDIRDLKTRTSC